VLGVHMRITQSIFTKHGTANWLLPIYQYIDLTAGPGDWAGVCDAKTGEPAEYQGQGSPCIFADVAAEVGMDYRALFIEKDETMTRRLIELFAGNDHIEIKRGDHIEELDAYLHAHPGRKRFGLVYYDPNGEPTGIECMAALNKHNSWKTVDVLLNLSANCIKRVRGACEGKRTLVEYLSSIGKKHWLVRGPHRSDRWQWAFFIGTNWNDFPEFRSHGFYSVQTAEGKAILKRLNFTGDELNGTAVFQLPGLSTTPGISAGPVTSVASLKRAM